MNRQLHQVHKARWNRFKKMNKRRVNQFQLEKRVANLESKLADEVELSRLNSGQIEDLMTALERKVERVLREQKKLKAMVMQAEKSKTTQKASLLAMFKRVLCSKGRP